MMNLSGLNNSGIIVCALILCLTALPAVADTDQPLRHVNEKVLLEAAPSEGFTFAVFGDFRPLRRDRPYPPVYNQTLAELNMIGPSFIISIGDAYYGYGGSLQRFRNELDRFVASLGGLDMPFFNVTGNHEVTGEAERRKIVGERFGRNFGSFDYGAAHFIFLDTEEAGAHGGLSEQQMQWLRKDLEANRDSGTIFVFLHRPLFSVVDPDLAKGKSFRNRAMRDALHDLFVRHKVNTVFAGHEHLYSSGERDGVRYVITGGGGAPLYGAPDKGGFYEYVLVTVGKGGVTLRAVVPYGLQIVAYRDSLGFDTKAEIEVSNITDGDLPAANIPVLMPLAAKERYTVKAVSISPYGREEPHQAKVRRVKNNGDGTAIVGIETLLPRNGLIRISVEVDI